MARKKLQIVLRNARKMQGMIDQLLQFRRIEKAEWNVNIEIGEIIGCTRESLMNLEPLWQAKNRPWSSMRPLNHSCAALIPKLSNM